MTEEPCLSLEEDVAQFCARMSKLVDDLAKTKVDENHDWFRKMLVGILISTRQNYAEVLEGGPQKPMPAFLGARNLLELRMITTYVLRSRDNAQDFFIDWLADQREFFENLAKVVRSDHDELVAEMKDFSTCVGEPFESQVSGKATEEEQAGPDLRRLESELCRVKNVMKNFGVAPNRKPKYGAAIAKLVEQDHRYGPRHKMLSKLVHPTSLSIAAQTSTDFFDDLVPMVHDRATCSMIAIFHAVKKHIETYGVAWQT